METEYSGGRLVVLLSTGEVLLVWAGLVAENHPAAFDEDERNDAVEPMDGRSVEIPVPSEPEAREDAEAEFHDWELDDRDDIDEGPGECDLEVPQGIPGGKKAV